MIGLTTATELLRTHVMAVAEHMRGHRAQLLALGEIFTNLRTADGQLRYGINANEDIYRALEEIYRLGQENGEFRDFDRRVMAITHSSPIDDMFAYRAANPGHDLDAHAAQLADLISGFFTPGSHERKGGRAFVRDRLIRLGIPLLVFLVVLRPTALATTGALSSALMTLWESVFAVSMIIGLTVTFRERRNRQGPRGRFLSEHAYTVYVIHPLVLVGLGWALRPLEAPAVVKFALLLAAALPLCWWLASLVRSLPHAKRVL